MMAAPRLAVRLALAGPSAMSGSRAVASPRAINCTPACPICLASGQAIRPRLSRYASTSSIGTAQYTTPEPLGDAEARPKRQQLLIEDKGARVSIEALDQVRPKPPPSERGTFAKRGPQAQAQWQGVVDNVLQSFSVTQLRAMARELGVSSGALHREKRAINANTINKICVARALVVKRFNLKDPRIAAQAQARGMKAQRSTLAVPMPVEALQLLYLYGRNTSRRTLQRHRATMRLARMDEKVDEKAEGDQPYGVVFECAEEAFTPLREFAARFAGKIVSCSMPLSKVTSSPLAKIPTQEDVASIARRSNALVTIGEEPDAEVRIVAMTDEDLTMACMLLTESECTRRQALRRLYYTWTSPAIPAEHETSVPTFALVPYTDSIPAHASVHESDAKMRFRLTRQDLDPTVQRWELKRFRDNVRLQSLLRTNHSGPDKEDQDIVGDLVEHHKEAQQGVAAVNHELVFSLRFGHLTFGNRDQASGATEHASVPISPPIAGSWPLEYALRPMRAALSASENSEAESSTKQTLDDSLPTLTPAIPPLMYQVDLHSLASMVSARRSSIVWQRMLSSIENEVVNDIDELQQSIRWESRMQSEFIRLTYVGSDGQLVRLEFVDQAAAPLQGEDGQSDTLEMSELHQQHQPDRAEDTVDNSDPQDAAADSVAKDDAEAQGDAGSERAAGSTADSKTPAQDWQLKRVTETHSREADVLVPEAIVDIRLNAGRVVHLGPGAISTLQNEFSTFCRALNTQRQITSQILQRHPIRISPPSRISMEGSEYSLLSASFVDHSSWEIRPLHVPKAEAQTASKAAQRRLLLELEKPLNGDATIEHAGIDYIPGVFDPQESSLGQEANADESVDSKGKLDTAGIWQWLRRSAEEIYKEPYRSLRGR